MVYFEEVGHSWGAEMYVRVGGVLGLLGEDGQSKAVRATSS